MTLIHAFVRPASTTGNRISLQDCVALFLLFDLLAIAGFGLLSTAAIGVGNALVDNQVLVIGFALFLFILLSRSADAYKSQRILDLRYSVRRLVAALLITFAILLTLGVASKTSQVYSRVWFFSWLALTCTIVPAFRIAVVAHIRNELGNKGGFVFRALSIGVFSDPLTPQEIARRTENQVKTDFAMRFDDFGALAGLSDRVARGDIDRIYLVVPWLSMPIALQHLQFLRNFSAQVFVLPESEWIGSSQLQVSTFGNRLSLTATNRPIDGWDLWSKRMLDVVVATTTIALFSPVLLGVAIAIKLESHGPVIFRQKRTGFNGSVFELWKFRTMYTEQTDPDATRQTTRSDPRVTRLGRFIRRRSLDELPQFFNVLQGRMSVVGPRPHALETRADGQLLQELVASYAARHRVNPGITGWAQINGLRGELDVPEKLKQRVKLDIEYIERWSIWLDLEIILRTVKLLVYDPAAY